MVLVLSNAHVGIPALQAAAMLLRISGWKHSICHRIMICCQEIPSVKTFPFVKTKRYYFLKPAASSSFSSKTSAALSEERTESTRAADILWSITLLMQFVF